jgi:hypothetical protein
VNHVSRRIMDVRVFRIRPTAKAVSAFLASMIRAAGQSPRHLITDRGREFTAKSLRRGCRRSGIRQRFGAIVKHGSIALVERCIRTLKDEGVWRWLAPVRWRSVGRELSLFADWFNGQHPHGGLRGATPTKPTSDDCHPIIARATSPGCDGRATLAVLGHRPRSTSGLACGSRSGCGTWKGERTFPSSFWPARREGSICGFVPAGGAVCARAARHAVRRSIFVAVLTLRPVSPR